ncbi:hypothetical protein RGQ15_10320 [Paracoccus sp. MBLB3053]|uniref:Lipoprotein n=1 Tax=Paracoccus aurantius TaxID=3073814 RepID=A0ABU2HUM2_9RHOB|nr:hypothetical protein [Paracoccus sp. MBLB3053]MDS9467959.1 hypothetical protein [Paracoccus sp. MBLB3053]
MLIRAAFVAISVAWLSACGNMHEVEDAMMLTDKKAMAEYADKDRLNSIRETRKKIDAMPRCSTVTTTGYIRGYGSTYSSFHTCVSY